MSDAAKPNRLAVDIGGTFTDIVLETEGGLFSNKLLTTPHEPETAVLEGTQALLRAHSVAPESIALVIHGTTLATNAVIERKGAHTALVTTAGFRDSVEIAYEHRFDQYDLYMTRPQPLVPRERRFEVTERTAADGAELLPLDEAGLRALAEVLREQAIEAVAVGFLHSYANPAHELRAGELLAEALPGVAITLSHEVCPEIREYDRISTACANAYITPLMASYLHRLEAGLGALGLDTNLLLMMSSGGVTTVQTAVRQPIRLVESGPAGGAILAANIARQNGCAQALSFDMGGTTAKLTLIDGFRPQYSRSFEVARAYRFLKGSGLPLRIPVIDMVEIGAGGGSIARLDSLGQIAVGPRSAGSNPGPACYGRGGQHPTVTDGDLQLGRINPERFADGKINLDPEASREAIERELVAPSGHGGSGGLDTRSAAAGIVELVDENMANAARVHAIENGKETRGRTLIAFGGAAPLHAGRLAEKLDIPSVIVPAGAGVGSAHGFLQAPIAYEVARTQLVSLDHFNAERVNTIFDDMRTEAERVVRQGAPDAPLVERREAYMRYRGQGHEITVVLPNRLYRADDDAAFKNLFDAAYAQIFARTIPRLSIEILTWTLSLSTEVPEQSPVVSVSAGAEPVSYATREVFDAALARFVASDCYERTDLASGQCVSGPAIITEAETSTVVPSSFDASINSAGQIVLNRKETS